MAYYLVDSSIGFAFEKTGQNLYHEKVPHEATAEAGAWHEAQPPSLLRRRGIIQDATPSQARPDERRWSALSLATGEVLYYPDVPREGAKILDANESLTEKANDDRIALLRRKYDLNYKLTGQESARLQILNERICRLIPSITKEENDELEAMAEVLAEARSRLDMLRDEFGHE